MYVFGSLSPDLHTDCSSPWSMLSAQSRPDIHMLRLVRFLQQALHCDVALGAAQGSQGQTDL